VDEPPAPNWVPDTDGDTLLRVAHKGRLERLELHYRNGLRPPAAAFQPYRCGALPVEAADQAGVFDEMVVYRLAGPTTLEIETTLKLTDALRAATLRRAQEVAAGVPELLSGHDAAGHPSAVPHAAYVALPFASDTEPHADGHILGLAVVLPRGITGAERRQAMRALVGLEYLTVPGIGRLGLERVTPVATVPYNLRPTTWSRPSRRWASVTPVLLERFPKSGSQSMEAILERGCTYVGLPRPIEVVAERHSPLYGVEPSFRFVVRRPRGLPKARLHTHVQLTFAEPVHGPVLLGAGRYFGLGLFRPLREGSAS
jgi:CRISPR-associated protein Csb2